jgi:magnesium chelatase subunit I
MKTTVSAELNNMNHKNIKTLADLKKSGYRTETIKDEIRRNLVAKLQAGETVFTGIHGYENSVIPDLERALLAGHNINFLGLRGQAKTRLARQMTGLLDEYIPALAHCELNDDPLNPISRQAFDIIADQGDKSAIRWIHRDERYFEKLATPDVSVADLIGDVDPIKAANLKLPYSDERTLHFGMIPRAHRSIFVINELPDLQARIQVALFNILQEGDIQIRGFKLRLPVDVQFVFTANPEDYTNRGSIVTPLKDRIGSQILTHYPKDRKTARKITQQEAKLKVAQSDVVRIPEVAFELLEQIAFEARENEFIDSKSGVSTRLTISALENLVSTAERRALLAGASKTTVRLMDFMGIIPAITGKVELVYEGEQEGAGIVAENLIGAAVKTIFPEYFPSLEDRKSGDSGNPYKALSDWFSQGKTVDMNFDWSDKEYQKQLSEIGPLTQLVQAFQTDAEKESTFFLMELCLWALAEHSKLNKERLEEGFNFADLFSSYLRGGEI